MLAVAALAGVVSQNIHLRMHNCEQIALFSVCRLYSCAESQTYGGGGGSVGRVSLLA